MSKSCIIDIGHGGRDPGSIGNKTQEKNNNLNLGLKVGKILQNHNVTVNYTRTTDKDFCFGNFDVNEDLQNRIAVAKGYGLPDIFISFHNNAFNKQAKGIECHCYKNGGGDYQLAQSVQNQLSKLNFVNRGTKISNFYVLRKFDGTKTDACLIEYGFIDSEEDAILANMDKASVLIAKGLLGHLGIEYVEEINSNEGMNDMLSVCVLLYSKEDYWAGADVAIKNGNCAIFIRPDDKSIPVEAMSAKRIITIGGSKTGHANETFISGYTKYDTANLVGKFLEQ